MIQRKVDVVDFFSRHHHLISSHVRSSVITYHNRRFNSREPQWQILQALVSIMKLAAKKKETERKQICWSWKITQERNNKGSQGNESSWVTIQGARVVKKASDLNTDQPSIPTSRPQIPFDSPPGFFAYFLLNFKLQWLPRAKFALLNSFNDAQKKGVISCLGIGFLL